MHMTGKTVALSSSLGSRIPLPALPLVQCNQPFLISHASNHSPLQGARPDPPAQGVCEGLRGGVEGKRQSTGTQISSQSSRRCPQVRGWEYVPQSLPPWCMRGGGLYSRLVGGSHRMQA